MSRECDWTLVTWEGSRRQQHQDFLALSFRTKLEVIEQLGETAALFAAWRGARGLPVRLPGEKRQDSTPPQGSPLESSGPVGGPCYAHTRPDCPEESWELLVSHLHQVAGRAREFAAAFDSADWGFLAGLWHDLGKYRPEFQRRLKGSREQVEHAGIGAALAAQRRGYPLAFIIAGHHAGLANASARGDSKLRSLRERVADNRPPLDGLLPSLPSELLQRTVPSLPPHLAMLPSGLEGGVSGGMELWIRFLFSALVDADYLATEAFLDPARRAARRSRDTIVTLRQRLDDKLAHLPTGGEVNKVRAQVLAECQSAAAEPPGVFSLTVPTGGGKTLSSMAFALRHAERHGLRRVIVAIPYTSIIEQNAEEYRKYLGSENVIEHHSNLDEAKRLEEEGEIEISRRLACENWDAPIVVTTNVQLFESLFANRPSRCRKLHNVARSVIVLDEVQTLPTQFLLCILDVLQDLAKSYGCSIVLSTATQPALARREGFPTGLFGVREIVSSPRKRQESLRRVRVEWPIGPGTVSWEQLASELGRHERVLVIVHLRKDARELARLLPLEGTFHLSALMCAAHRTEELERIKVVLEAGGTCRVVATQLIEAGVNIDFPVVYRALAGLDSLAQAAGRCNREGVLADEEGRLRLGQFKVFRAPTSPPPGTLRKGLESVESMLQLQGNRLDLTDGPTLDEYFRMLYSKSPLDQRGVQTERRTLNFATVAEKVQLIEDGHTHAVVVPWGDGDHRIRRFAAAPNRETQRALQPYVVQVREHELRALVGKGAVVPLGEAAYELTRPFLGMYHKTYGLLVSTDAVADPEALMT